MGRLVADNTTPHPKRRWLQFRLRTLLIAILLLSLPLSWFAWRMERARRQRDAVEVIRGTGGYTIYDAQKPSVPPVLLKVLGQDFFHKVRVAHTVNFNTQRVELLGSLIDLKSLHLSGRLRDSDLEYIAGLRDLNHLSVFSKYITNAGLVHLRGLTNLVELDLTGTNVTPEGVKKLQEALPNCKIAY